jgi:hypothetical protein
VLVPTWHAVVRRGGNGHAMSLLEGIEAWQKRNAGFWLGDRPMGGAGWGQQAREENPEGNSNEERAGH